MTPANTLTARMIGVVRSPRATFEAVAAAPRWAGVLTVTFLLSASTAALFLDTEVGRLALLDQWERTAAAFGRPVDDVQYAALDAASDNGAAYAVISAVMSGPLLALVLSVIVRAMFRASRPGAPTYRQVFAVVAHAGVILALRQVIAAPVDYARETLASPMTIGVIVGGLDEASPLARLAGIVDLFVIWWVAVLAIGVSVLYHRPAIRLVATCVGIYVVLAVAVALAMAVTGGSV